MTPIQIPGPNGPFNVLPELIHDPALRARLFNTMPPEAIVSNPAASIPSTSAINPVDDFISRTQQQFSPQSSMSQPVAPMSPAPLIDPVSNFIARTQNNVNLLDPTFAQPVPPSTPDAISDALTVPQKTPSPSPLNTQWNQIEALAAPEIAANEATARGLTQQASLIKNYIQQMEKDLEADKSAQQNALDKYNQAQKDLETAKAKSKEGFWANKTLGQKIAAGLGLLLGGAVSGVTGRQNPTTQILLNALEEDADQKLAMIESADRNVARERQYLDIIQQRFATRPQQRLALLDLNLQEAQKQAEAAALRAKTPEAYQKAMAAVDQMAIERKKVEQALLKGEIDIAKSMQELQAANEPAALKEGVDAQRFFEESAKLDQERELLNQLNAVRTSPRRNRATENRILDNIAGLRTRTLQERTREVELLADTDINVLQNDLNLRRQILNQTFQRQPQQVVPSGQLDRFKNQIVPTTPGAR